MLLDVKKIIKNPAQFDQTMQYRTDPARSIQILNAYNSWRESNEKLEQIAAEINALSKKFTPENALRAGELKIEKDKIVHNVREKREKLDFILDRVPNMLHPEVPHGESDADNKILSYHGEKISIPNPKHHEDIASELKMWGRDEAVEMSGSRFMCLTGDLARLERILGQFVIDRNRALGFIEMSVPYLVKPQALYNTGQLPKFEEAHFSAGNHALIPTSEVPLLNYYAGKILGHKDLPLKLTALTPCFRSEAGSLGRDTKGLTRLHQFTKVEMVAITKPEDSAEMHANLLEIAQSVLRELELPYRIVEICSADIGFTAMRQYDLEVWMPGQNKYIEVASCSNCGDFQARRMGTKYRDESDQLHYVHTLNSTAVACGRVLAAILENHCQSGQLHVPKAVEKYWDR